MRAIARARTSTRATSFMLVKGSTGHFQNNGKILISNGFYNQFDIYQRSRVSLLEPRQNNLSNLETPSETYQAFKMKFFAKIVNG